MAFFDHIAIGFSAVFTMQKMLYCFFGVFMGMMMGVLPGIGAMATISMLLPITFYVAPDVGLIMLAGIYYGAQYGGSIASILLNLPGTPSSAVICLDGYPMARKGRAGPAIFLTTVASFLGSMFAIMLLLTIAPVAARLALTFGAADYFSLMILGLIAAASLAQHGVIRGLSMVAVGLTLGMVGTDVASGTYRFTFGLLDLADGLSIIAMAMGLFGVAEIISNLVSGAHNRRATQLVALRDLAPTKEATCANRRDQSCEVESLAHFWASCRAQELRSPHSWHTASEKADFQDTRQVRKRARARNRCAGSSQQRSRTGGVHPDTDPRNPGRRGHGADDECADHTRHSARPHRHRKPPRPVLGSRRQFCHRQSIAAHHESAPDRRLGTIAGHSLPLPLSRHPRAHLRGCLRCGQQCL